MSHFYGTIYGSGRPGWNENDGPIASRRGTAKSGLEAVLSSPEGTLFVRLYEGEAEDGGLEDRVRVRISGFELYDGPLSECRFESIRRLGQRYPEGALRRPSETLRSKEHRETQENLQRTLPDPR